MIRSRRRCHSFSFMSVLFAAALPGAFGQMLWFIAQKITILVDFERTEVCSYSAFQHQLSSPARHSLALLPTQMCLRTKYWTDLPQVGWISRPLRALVGSHSVSMHNQLSLLPPHPTAVSLRPEAFSWSVCCSPSAAGTSVGVPAALLGWGPKCEGMSDLPVMVSVRMYHVHWAQCYCNTCEELQRYQVHLWSENGTWGFNSSVCINAVKTNYVLKYYFPS